MEKKSEKRTTYSDAIRSVSKIMDVTEDFTIYDASVLLSRMFRADRKMIVDEIIKYRGQKESKK